MQHSSTKSTFIQIAAWIFNCFKRMHIEYCSYSCHVCGHRYPFGLNVWRRPASHVSRFAQPQWCLPQVEPWSSKAQRHRSREKDREKDGKGKHKQYEAVASNWFCEVLKYFDSRFDPEKKTGIGIVKVSVSSSYAPLKSIVRVTIWMSFHWSSTYYIAAMTVACTQQWCNLTCQSQSFPAGLLFLRAVRGPGCVSRFGGSGLAKDGSLAVITIEHILNNSCQQPMGHWHLSTFIDNDWCFFNVKALRKDLVLCRSAEVAPYLAASFEYLASLGCSFSRVKIYNPASTVSSCLCKIRCRDSKEEGGDAEMWWLLRVYILFHFAYSNSRMNK